MRYQVSFVEDSALPSGVEFTFVRLAAGTTHLFVKHSAIDTTTGQCDALTRAWELWQEVEVEAVRRSPRAFLMSAAT